MNFGPSALYFGIPALALTAGFYLHMSFISNGVGLAPILLGVLEK